MKTKIKFLLIAVGIFISGNLFAQSAADPVQSATIQVTEMQEQAASEATETVEDKIAASLAAGNVETAAELAVQNYIPFTKPQNSVQPQHTSTPFNPSNPGMIPTFASTGNSEMDAQLVFEWLVQQGLVKP